MRNSLRKKYIIAGCLLILGFLVFLSATSRLLKEGIVGKWNRDRLRKVAAGVIRELNGAEWDMSEMDIDALAFENSVYITVIDEEKNILATTRSIESHRGTLGKRTQWILQNSAEELEEQGECFSSNFDDDSHRDSFVLINRIPDRGYVIVRNSVLGLKSSMRVMEICYLLAAVFTLLCGIPVTICLARKMTRPIYEINRVTKQIAELNFTDSVHVKGEDELSMLADSVNLMSSRLEEAMRDLQQDVESRKALVRNMAHELKTPVAVIMGYAENMPYVSAGESEKLEKYCDVIVKECGRMNSIIQRLLKLSAYEDGGGQLHVTSFPAQRLLQNIRKRYMDEYPARAGTYEESDHVGQEIEGDLELLQDALYNFVKNAVRYGKADGLIRVCAWEEEDRIWFSVFNQGDAIPEWEQKKIWDVFYKSNPARTRDEDSFGIGLSIARQVALLHGGGVTVENVDDGVKFCIYIKKKIGDNV